MKKFTIMVADNNAQFLNSCAGFLEENGYRVLRAGTLAEARKIMEEGRLDLALLDIRLERDTDAKDTSGLTLAKEVARSLPKVIVTNNATGPNAAEALRPQADGLPSAVEFVDKEDGTEAILQAVKRALSVDLEWMRSVQKALGGIDSELEADYKNAQSQANANFNWALIFAIAGAVMALLGIGLAYFQKVEIVLVTTVASLISELIGYLFYRRVDKANNRMDGYHRERLEGQRFEVLLKACDGFEAAIEREALRKQIILTTSENWLKRRLKPAAHKDAPA